MNWWNKVHTWLRRGWRGVKALVVMAACLIVAVSLARDAYARAQTNALLAKLPATIPNPMPDMRSGMRLDIHDPHMTTTPLIGKPTAVDIAEAQAILVAARQAATKYTDITAALAAGYKQATPYFHGMAHYTNYVYAALAGAAIFDPRRPTSLLYTRSGKDYHLIGVMFTAPESDTAADLNALVPTSIARWHYHHDLCLGGVLIGRAPNAASCIAGGGAWWAKTVWMLHVWTDQQDLAHALAMDHPSTQSMKM